jgi:hypothetical protein
VRDQYVLEKKEGVDLSALPTDPARRKPISQYKLAKVRDDVRSAYLQKGPFQPVNYNFPQTDMSGIICRFKSVWFKEYNWLEYSIEEELQFIVFLATCSKLIDKAVVEEIHF